MLYELDLATVQTLHTTFTLEVGETSEHWTDSDDNAVMVKRLQLDDQNRLLVDIQGVTDTEPERFIIAGAYIDASVLEQDASPHIVSNIVADALEDIEKEGKV